jgi:hypothetical protein
VDEFFSKKPLRCPFCAAADPLAWVLPERGWNLLYANKVTSVPISKRSQDNVTLRCKSCGRSFQISGRGAARRLREGKPLLS